MTENESFNRATSAALRYLAHRPRSAGEVRKRLIKDFPSDIVERVIDDLKEQSYIDDANFAKLWVNNRDSLKPRSAFVVKRELSTKGISKDIAEVAVSEMDDAESAYRAASSHARRLADLGYSTFQRRMWAYLQRRGYSASVIRHTITQLWTEIGDSNS